MELLQQAIAEFLLQGRLTGTVRLTTSQARLRALLYETANVKTELELPAGGWELDIEIDKDRFERLRQSDGLEFLERTQQPSLMVQN